MASHDTGCVCSTYARLKAKSIPAAKWIENHQPCLPAGFTFGTGPFPHPSGTWYWLVCPCGAKHLTMETSMNPNEGKEVD